MGKNTNLYQVHPAFMKKKSIKGELKILTKFPSLKNLHRRKDLALEYECSKDVFGYQNIDDLYKALEDKIYSVEG